MSDDAPTDKRKLAELALGRILRLAARPAQAGDVAEYECCRAIILHACEPAEVGWQPNYARDRGRSSL